MNLTILLLESPGYVSRSTIQQRVVGYDLPDDAGYVEKNFLRMFEHDKDDLRAMGIPIETGIIDPLFEDEVGYRIARSDFELPPIEFSHAEATVLGIAANVWQSTSPARRAVSALSKLRAVGVEPQPATGLTPQVGAREQAFEPIFEAVLTRRVVCFYYRGASELRTVEPWRVAWRKGSWYVLGFDHTRAAPRLFKMSRIDGVPKIRKKQFSHLVPDVAAQEQHLLALGPRPNDTTAVIAIDGDRAPALRRRGEACDIGFALPPGFKTWRVSVNRDAAVPEIASYGPSVIVCEPRELRDEVIAHLLGVIDSHQQPRDRGTVGAVASSGRAGSGSAGVYDAGADSLEIDGVEVDGVEIDSAENAGGKTDDFENGGLR